MTTNIDRAIEVIGEAYQEAMDSGTPSTWRYQIARRLADDGLLRPDPPAPYLHAVTAWQAKCSQCGYIQDDYGDFTAMDAVGVVEEVLAGGWVLEDDRLFCDSCQGKEADRADA